MVRRTTRPGEQLEDHDYRVLADFRRAIRNFLAFSAEGAADRGLTSQQHQALLAIRAHPGPEAMSIGELSVQLSIKNHSAIGLVSRLTAGGFVRRARSDVDRRRVLLRLTKAGAAVLEEISVRNLGELGRASVILEQLLQTTRDLAAGREGR